MAKLLWHLAKGKRAMRLMPYGSGKTWNANYARLESTPSGLWALSGMHNDGFGGLKTFRGLIKDWCEDALSWIVRVCGYKVVQITRFTFWDFIFRFLSRFSCIDLRLMITAAMSLDAKTWQLRRKKTTVISASKGSRKTVRPFSRI